MRAQLACVFVLCLTCGGLCSDVDQEQRALEEELLSSLFTSKIKQTQQRSRPPWQSVSLLRVCRMVGGGLGLGGLGALGGLGGLGRTWQEAWSSGEGGLRERLAPLLGPLEELYDLQHLCRVLQPRQERLLHDSREPSDPGRERSSQTLRERSSQSLRERSSQNLLKRKSPYILKRQTKSSKSRRPYILKRNTFY